MMGSVILIVEDDDAIRTALRDTLTDVGYRVVCAKHGREAMEFLKDKPPPALILLDLDMPVMNGWEFRMEQSGDPVLAVIPVVLTSALPQTCQLAKTLTVETFLRKPIRIGELLSVVNRYCGVALPAYS